jgi:hypothetical protein
MRNPTERSIEIIEQPPTALNAVFVARTQRRNSCDDAGQSRCFIAAKLGVLAVDVMHDLADLAQRWIVWDKRLHKSLKRARVSDMRVFGFEHIESELAGLICVALRIDKVKPRSTIDESANEPCARDPVDMNVLTRDPCRAVEVTRGAIPGVGGTLSCRAVEI